MTNVAESVESAEATRRIPALDGLRGLAILLVMIFHFTRLPILNLPGFDPSGLSAFDVAWVKVVGVGWTGVNLFFILSGFLITGILYESKGPIVAYFRNFYARRVLRIFPAYFAFLLVLFFLLPVLMPSESDGIQFIRNQQVWFWTYLLNIHHYIDPRSLFGPTYLYGHIWSLMVEEQFYLVWPVVVLLFNRRLLIAVAVAMIVTAFTLRIVLLAQGDFPLLIYSFTPTRMDDLAIGALIALLVRGAETRRYLAMFAWPVAGISLIGLIVLFFARSGLPALDPWILRAGLTLIGLFFGGLFAGVILSPPTGVPRAVLSHPYIRWLGRYSYAIYIIHLPVVNLLLRHTDLAQSVPDVFGSYVPRAIVTAAVATVITFALALASWRLVESPFLRLRTRFPQKSATLVLQKTE